MRVDLVNKTFGKLTVREMLPQYMCRCDCSCGKTDLIKRCESLRSGNTKSCGCARVDSNRARATHGESAGGQWTPEYTAWTNMVARCTNANRDDFKDYGGRGVTVCPRWRTSFKSFLLDMGRKPSLSHSVERIDNSLGYSADNCRWATKTSQSRNRRGNRIVSAFGKTSTVAEWAEASGIPRHTIACRLNRGWTAESAVSTVPIIGRNQSGTPRAVSA